MMNFPLTTRMEPHGARKLAALLLCVCLLATMLPMAALADHTTVDASISYIIITADTSLGRSTDCTAAIGTAKAGDYKLLHSKTTMTASDGGEWYQVANTSDPNGFSLVKLSAARAATANEQAAILAGTYASGATTTTTTSTTTTTAAATSSTYKYGNTNAVNVVLRTSAGGERSGKLIAAKGTTVQVISSATVSSISWSQIYYSGVLYWVQSKYLSLLTDAENNAYYDAHKQTVYTGTDSTTNPSASSAAGTLKTTASVNIRRYASTSSTKLGVVPKGVSMGYTNTATVGSVTWYYITYGGVTGYIMGKYVSASGSSDSTGSTGGTTDSTTALGTITTTSGVKLRKSASQTADKYGLVPKNTTLSYYGTAVVSGVTWYRVKYSGHNGYLMGTYVTLNGSSGGGGTINPTATEKTYVKLAANTPLFTASVYAAGTPTVNAPAGSVLQLVNATPYTGTDGASYYSVYYQSEKFNVQAVAVTGNILTNDQLVAYFKGTLWVQKDFESFKRSAGLIGDVRVHGLQYALKLLGYYTGALDGDYGSGSESAVKKFQRAAKLEVDGFAGQDTQRALYDKALGTSSGGSGSDTSGGGTTPGGTVTPDSDKTYVRLTTNVYAFTSATKPTDLAKCTRLPAGSVLQLVSATPITESGIEYYVLYYASKPYRVLGSEMKTMILSAADLSSYITSYWSQSSFDSLKRVDDLVGDVRVHALQLALKNLGYYTGVIDGDLGAGTESAVKKFQRAAKLEVDGFAGQDTQSALYKKVLGSSGGSGSGTGTASTDKTYVQLSAAVKLYRDSACTQAATTAPAGSVLQLFNPTGYALSGATYYQLYYNNALYNVPAASVESAKMSATALYNYLVSLWRAGYAVNINTDVDWVGDIRVHALQLALKQLGYYTGSLDGTYGSGTESAVRNFQRAKGLTRDGRCGPDTTTALFSAVLATTGGGSTVVGNEYGFLATTGANVVVYSQASTSSARVITLPTAGTILTRASAAPQAGTGGSFYQINYGGNAFVLASAVKEMTSVEYSAFLTAATNGTAEAYYSYTLKKGSSDDTNGYISALQRRLQYLGFYYLAIDGSFGDGTLTAVQAFQKAVGLTVDGIAASSTLHKLYGTRASSGSTEFGGATAVYSPNIEAGRWFTQEGGTTFAGVPAVFTKGTYAMVYDCATGLSFKVRRWAGAFHADVEPATAADTQVMCQIYGVTYPTGTPSSAELKKIYADTLCWPNINATSHWQRRSVLVNVNGKVFCGSMYGVPHNANDANTITNNNYYGQFCIWFRYSYNHSSSGGYAAPGTSRRKYYDQHQDAILSAFNDYAVKLFSSSIIVK